MNRHRPPKISRQRRKRCVVCNELFMPQFTSTQRACSPKCAYTYVKLKEADKRAQLNKLRNEKKTRESYEEALRTTERVVHEYVRERDKGKSCASCGATWRSDFQAGHVHPKKKFSMIRFDFDNVHGQCPGCNLYEEGNYDAYKYRLPLRIGQERFDALVRRAEVAFKVAFTFSREDLKRIRDDARKKLAELKKKI